MPVSKILVSQPRPATEHNPYAELEEVYNVKFDFHQLISIEGLDAKEFRKQHVYIQEYSAVFMNSRLAIDHFFRLCQEMRIQVSEDMHYYCISEMVANYLQKYIQYRNRRIFRQLGSARKRKRIHKDQRRVTIPHIGLRPFAIVLCPAAH